MYLCKYIGIESFIGSIIATVIGYIISIGISIYYLKKESITLKFNETFKILGKIIISVIVMILVLFILDKVLIFNLYNKLSAIIYTFINSIIGALVYIILTYKLNVIESIFGNSFIDKIKKKLHIKKI